MFLASPSWSLYIEKSVSHEGGQADLSYSTYEV